MPDLGRGVLHLSIFLARAKKSFLQEDADRGTQVQVTPSALLRVQARGAVFHPSQKEEIVKEKAIIFLLLISSIACSSADYASAFHIDYESQEAPISPLLSEVTLDATAPVAVTSTAFPSMQVCTGVENGTLRVRKGAGTSEAVVTFLVEGTEVEVLEEKEPSEGGTWSKISNGWVNKRYLCEMIENIEIAERKKND